MSNEDFITIDSTKKPSKPMDNREPVDITMMRMAHILAERSTRIRRKVGAIATNKHGLIVAAGYNGAPSGNTYCSVKGCYREQNNIPSGTDLVKCLHGDTVVKLLNGTYKTIKQLADNGDPFWVYSQDIKTNQLKPAQAIRPRFTGYRDDLVEVVLDNGYSFKCTEDHLILLRHNVYCKAGDLNINDCLMPMYYNFTYNNKYESIYNTYRETPYESYRNPPI